jgi:TPR repeat protein
VKHVGCPRILAVARAAHRTSTNRRGPLAASERLSDTRPGMQSRPRLLLFGTALLVTWLAGTPRALARHGALPSLEDMEAQGPRTLELASAALKRDPREAKELAEACNDGAQDACLALGADYELGNGVERSASRALELYRNGCAQGIQLACALEGWLIVHELAAKDGRRRRPLDAACRAGESLGCYALGMLAWEGKGERKSVPRAALIWQRACARGELLSCSSLNHGNVRARKSRRC